METEAAMKPDLSEPLLQVDDLRVAFRGEEMQVTVLAGLDFLIHPREVVCFVGESGCGKTLTALSILGILPATARVESGSILFRGENLLNLSNEELQRIRGKEISMIFQEPMTSLNPVFTVGHQIEEAIAAHEELPPEENERRVIRLLEDVGIPAPQERLRDYPHQLSGGQRQRVMIAMALACYPRLVVADEPTTALDVTIQAQILGLFRRLQQNHDMSLIYITHDLRVVAHLAHRIYVMYSGLMVEEGNSQAVFNSPHHPYTKGLMASLPGKAKRGERLHAIPGNVPDPANRPPGCPFHPRCPDAMTQCRRDHPEMLDFGDAHKARCPVAYGSW